MKERFQYIKDAVTFLHEKKDTWCELIVIPGKHQMSDVQANVHNHFARHHLPVAIEHTENLGGGTWLLTLRNKHGKEVGKKNKLSSPFWDRVATSLLSTGEVLIEVQEFPVTKKSHVTSHIALAMGRRGLTVSVLRDMEHVLIVLTKTD